MTDGFKLKEAVSSVALDRDPEFSTHLVEVWQPRPGDRVRLTRGQRWGRLVVPEGATATVVEFYRSDADDMDNGVRIKLHAPLMWDGVSMALVWVASEDLAPVEEVG